MNQFSLPALLIASLLALPARAEEQTVGQKDKQFSQKDVMVKRGDSVLFRNDDTVTHNISVHEPGGARRAGIVEQPGSDAHVAFDGPGDYDVNCLIHPRMKMTVHVE